MARSILIVEDNELNMKLFDDLLQASGYSTIKSIDGSDVLKIVREHCPGLVLMDIQLPGRSGLDIIKDMKADVELKHTPVVVVTAFVMNGYENKLRKAGCDDYIAKPISIPAFLETVARHLLRPASECP